MKSLFFAITFLTVVFSFSGAFAGNTPYCRPYRQGFQVFVYQDPMGEGYYRTRNGCESAIANAKNGFVCAAQEHGAKVVDIDSATGKPLSAGRGVWPTTSECNQAVQNSRDILVCAADDNRAVLYSRNANGALGSGHFTTLSVCLQALRGAINNMACGAQNSGAGQFTLSGIKLGIGVWSRISTCNQAISKVDGIRFVCAPYNVSIAPQVRLADTFTGIPTGPIYSSLEDCQRDIPPN